MAKVPGEVPVTVTIYDIPRDKADEIVTFATQLVGTVELTMGTTRREYLEKGKSG